MTERYRIILCVYCGELELLEETWKTDSLIDTGTCGRCYEQLKEHVNLKKLYKIEENRIVRVKT